MSDSEKLYTTQLDDDELTALVGLSGEDDRRWCFVEGPTASGFWPQGERPNSKMITTLWSLRLFGPESELAARRLDFESHKPWLARWSGAENPGDGWTEHLLDASSPIETDVLLFAQQDAKEEKLESFGTERGSARRRAPHITGDEPVWLTVSTTSPTDGKGAVQRWVRIKSESKKSISESEGSEK
jgi:hypothetical protein